MYVLCHILIVGNPHPGRSGPLLRLQESVHGGAHDPEAIAAIQAHPGFGDGRHGAICAACQPSARRRLGDEHRHAALAALRHSQHLDPHCGGHTLLRHAR